MNREERRKFVKQLQKNGISKPDAESMLQKTLNSQVLPEGTKVKLDVMAIKEDKNYKIKSSFYKDFVDNNSDTVFTVKYDDRYVKNPVLVKLAEDESGWLFYTGDLIVVD